MYLWMYNDESLPLPHIAFFLSRFHPLYCNSHTRILSVLPSVCLVYLNHDFDYTSMF